MAEGFAHKYAPDGVEIYSAGSNPAGFVHKEAIVAMRELGIDLMSQTSKGFNDIPNTTYDYAVTMGCGVTCPAYPAKHVVDWQIPDPVGRGIDYFRQVRDDIGARVKDLFEAIKKGGD